jgi:hypothetical protein
MRVVKLRIGGVDSTFGLVDEEKDTMGHNFTGVVQNSRIGLKLSLHCLSNDITDYENVEELAGKIMAGGELMQGRPKNGKNQQQN